VLNVFSSSTLISDNGNEKGKEKAPYVDKQASNGQLHHAQCILCELITETQTQTQTHTFPAQNQKETSGKKDTFKS
jgi:hypothetical protein